MVGKEAPPEERFWRFVEKTDSCWLWTGTRINKGYGHFNAGKEKKILAHRFSYIMHKAPIPEGMFILHSCDNPPCVNPEHLRVGTKIENSNDMIIRGRVYNAKITIEIADKIRAEYVLGEISHRELGIKYGISQTRVCAIVNNKSWVRLPTD